MLIDYDVVRSNRKTIEISVERDANILVKVPYELANEAIEKQVHKKRLWIWEKLAIKKSYQSDIEHKKFVSGESFLYLGRNYRLEMSDEDIGLKLKSGWFVLGKKQHSNAKEIFKAWYSEHLRRKLQQRLKIFEKYYGLGVLDFRVLELGYRWGSCSKDGTLNFNWKIAMAPLGVVDYIIAHEIAHFKEATHSEKFWKEVQRLMPNYLEKKEWLKQNGHELFI